MKKNRKVYAVEMLGILCFSLSACKMEASPDGITDGALSNGEEVTIEMTQAVTPEISQTVTPKTSQTIIPEISQAVNISDENKSKDSALNQELPPITVKPELKLNDVLGEFTTSYATSSETRKKNIENAAKILNGKSVAPGETFSCYEAIEPITEENGYASAHAYSGGKIISSVGGGVCQISSTLYNAVLLAELEIVERSPHSMTVSYIELGRDAAMAEEYKDFKFKNNLEHAIVIKAEAKEGTLHFTILGEEERKVKNRKIVFELKVISETPPPEDVITYDETKPADYTKVTQAAHTGYEVELYKVIYINGKEKERVKINSSIYYASPQYITAGVGKKN